MRFWVIHFCTESMLQTATDDGWKTIRTFRGIGHEEQAKQALAEIESEYALYIAQTHKNEEE